MCIIFHHNYGKAGKPYLTLELTDEPVFNLLLVEQRRKRKLNRKHEGALDDDCNPNCCLYSARVNVSELLQ
jgi:hypothetical protein